MQSLYNLLIKSAEKVLPLTGRFSDKMRLFVEGRKHLFEELEKQISPTDKTLWFHAASLGEYEQAVPVIEKVRQIFPEHKVVLSFFSPSGYELKKNKSLADVVTYLPLDTAENARQFIDLIHPDWVLFIKYEFWPNFLTELHKQKINTLLISGAFREDQLFFKSYGKWMRKYLKTFDHFFLQNESSRELLSKIGFKNSSVSGDTRFDRVSLQLDRDNYLAFAEEFKDGKICVVAGSTWPEDEALLTDFINNAPAEVKFIIAPHAIKADKIMDLKRKLKLKTILYSEKEGKELAKARVLIIDNIGLLSRLYSYADIAYVGGAAGETGLHNILEPATFGVPIIIGRNYQRFPEALQLQKLQGLFSVSNAAELENILQKLIEDREFRTTTGSISRKFISENTGATEMVANYLQQKNSVTD